jgi:DNA-directed RNA polymerase specialized sigma24 family protein
LTGDVRKTVPVSAIPELSDDGWKELLERLTHHAACRVLRHTWRGLRLSQGGAVPGGVDPADLAAEAITDVIDGTRQWNRETDPDFLDFLRSVVDSKVSHLVNRTENRVARRLAAVKEGAPEFQVADPHPDPATEFMNAKALEEFHAAVLKEIAGDNLVEGIFECLAAEITKPSEMADVLGVSVKEVNNAQKRLKRKVEGVLKNTKRR